MTPQQYECAIFTSAVWRLAVSNNVDELIAIACTIRNYVVPRMGQIATYKSYFEACDNFLKVYPHRAPPEGMEDALLSYPDGLLANIDQIYDCSHPDITSNQNYPNGARHFARVQNVEPDSWFDVEIIKKPAVHVLLGAWGAQQFWT